MGCCSGCDTGAGCQTGCSGTGCGPGTGCATCAPPQPAQLFVPNFFPATGCADGSCSLPPATGRMSVPQWLGAFANAARHLPPPPPISASGLEAFPYRDPGNVAPHDWAKMAYGSAYVPLPSPAQAAQTSFMPFWAVVDVLTGEPGMNLRAGPSPRAALVGAIPNGTRVWVTQIGIPEIGAPPGALMEWWGILVLRPGVTRIPIAPSVFVRAVGIAGERNVKRIS